MRMFISFSKKFILTGFWLKILVSHLIEVVDKVVRGGEARKRKAKELGVLSSRCIGGGGGGGRYQ